MSLRTAPAIKEAVRFWWIRNGQAAGLAIALVGGGAVVAAFVVPTVATTTIDGVVTGFVTTSSDTGTGFSAVVDVEGRKAVVPLSVAHRCFVGTTIRLLKTRTLLLGDHYASAGNGCDSTPGAGR